MSNNGQKKMFIYSSKESKALFEGILSDLAEAESRSMSSMIELCLSEALLPKNKQARLLIQLLYTAKGYNVNEALASCFSWLAAGISQKAKYSNAEPLVRFAYNLDCFAHGVPDANAHEMPHMVSQLSSIVTRLQDEKSPDAEYANKLLEQVKDPEHYFILSNVYQLILENWDMFKDWTYTYRLLSDLALLQAEFPNDAETKCELRKILIDISQEWDD